VYRHFPTERQLHDAVMQRLEVEAGIRYEDVTLSNVGAVSERVFASLSRFAVGESTVAPEDPTFAVADQRRQDALRRAVDAARPDWTDEQREAAAAMLDVLWNLPTYERLVAHWKFDHDRAVKTIGWMLDHVLHEIERDAPPPV
jgi:AcrR family transcriptional regulator